jgi:three-Cys-motif partner protein
VTAKKPPDQAHSFGGDWTEVKLGVLSKYLHAYTTALQEQPTKARPFTKLYIDAFAGTGYRQAPESNSPDSTRTAKLPFPDLADPEPQRLLEGSAARALKTDPPFQRYIFIERSPERCRQLEELRKEFPSAASRITIIQGEANAEIQRRCASAGWRSQRAVLFLDPYGMAVEWETIAAVAKTRSIDLWVLYPLGMGVNRVLTRAKEFPPGWAERLTSFFGTDKWREELYQTRTSPGLFGESIEEVKQGLDVLGRYFVERLASVFPKVAAKPAALRNRSGSPLYLLCFAAANPKGGETALKIANHLLRGVS